jgi:hypothetical protein
MRLRSARPLAKRGAFASDRIDRIQLTFGQRPWPAMLFTRFNGTAVLVIERSFSYAEPTLEPGRP